MRILVLSDSHGDTYNLKSVISMHREAEIIVFLGDGEDDFEYARKDIKDKMIYAVRGNRDFYSQYPEHEVFSVNSQRIYATHGYVDMVKYGSQVLLEKAQENNCKLALYGHTHFPKLEYENGIYLFCPGSIRDGQYGMVDISDAGIMCINAEI